MPVVYSGVPYGTTPRTLAGSSAARGRNCGWEPLIRKLVEMIPEMDLDFERLRQLGRLGKDGNASKALP